MPLAFDHHTSPQRIVFRTGGAREALSHEVAGMGAERVMLIASVRDEARARDVASGVPLALIDTGVTPHVPVERGTEATAAAIARRVDLIVAFGGGSAVGLAKFVARETGIPIIAVPTTYAGSEATSVWGQTTAGIKTTGVDDRVLPRMVIYDAEFTLSLPLELTVSSGMNALAHGVDAMWAPKTDPIARTFAEEGIRALAASLPVLVNSRADIDARELCLYGAYMSAAAFATTGSGLHHKICHVLGGRFDLPHAQTHTSVLPHVLAFNATAAPEADARIARALDAPTALEGLERLYDAVDAPRALSTYGYTAAQIAESVGLIVPSVPASNPRPVTADDLERVLTAALHGRPPLR
ncbi:maleylacetate reductase [Microbacterium rhizophilus]|uniref:maleylacetate reductase n=1 Tax=Microbacterium rhizophilus TaxID=3138934 RepID=UPI0031EF4947